MYNISEGHSATEGNELGIFEGIGDVYAQEDLDLFFSTLYSYVTFAISCGVTLDFQLTSLKENPQGHTPHSQVSRWWQGSYRHFQSWVRIRSGLPNLLPDYLATKFYPFPER